MPHLPRLVRGSESEVSDYQLRKLYVRLHPDVWVRNDLELDPLLRAEAAWLWSRGRAVLTGYSAAAVHGAKYLPNSANAELVIDSRCRPPAGITVHRRSVPNADRVTRRTMRITTPARTAFDLCRDQSEDAAIEAVDALYQATGLTRSRLVDYCTSMKQVRGIGRVLPIVGLTDEGAESIWETRTRLFIVRAGLPRPKSQIVIRDVRGNRIGRFDLVYEREKVIIEYDGDQHFESPQRNRDVVRWNALVEAGWTLIRVKASQLFNNPALLVGQIERALNRKVERQR